MNRERMLVTQDLGQQTIEHDFTRGVLNQDLKMHTVYLASK